MLAYPALLAATRTDDAGFLPGFPGSTHFRDDEPDALARAADLLEDVLADYIENRRDVPAPSKTRKRDRHVTLPVLTEAKVNLYQEMRAAALESRVARRLGCHMRQV